MPSVRGTLGVKVCVLGRAMSSVRGTLGCKDKELVSCAGPKCNRVLQDWEKFMTMDFEMCKIYTCIYKKRLHL